jgi:small-conductance mechanosensitive channel
MISSAVLEFTQFFVVAVVVALLWLLRKALHVVRLRPTYRARLDLVLPAMETVVGAVFFLWAVWFLFPRDTGAVWWAAGALVLGFVGAGWFAFRDLVSGVILRSERAYAPGQWIQTDLAEGFIADLGYRTMAIETDAGMRIRIPYSQLGRTALTTADRTQTARAHTFELELPATSAVADLTTRIRSAALTAFWSSPHRDPYVHYLERRGDRHRFEVVAFCLDDSYATDLEQSVRRQMEAGR